MAEKLQHQLSGLGFKIKRKEEQIDPIIKDCSNVLCLRICLPNIGNTWILVREAFIKKNHKTYGIFHMLADPPPKKKNMENNHKFFMCLNCVLDHSKTFLIFSLRRQNDINVNQHMENSICFMFFLLKASLKLQHYRDPGRN